MLVRDLEKTAAREELSFMSKALRGVDIKDSSESASVFLKPLAVTGFRHKRHKRQYLMSFLVFTPQGQHSPQKPPLQKSAIL